MVAYTILSNGSQKLCNICIVPKCHDSSLGKISAQEGLRPEDLPRALEPGLVTVPFWSMDEDNIDVHVRICRFID